MTTITKTNSKNVQSVSATARDLRAAMQGQVLLPGDDDYTNARQVWNGAVEHRPALFALCKTVEDVQTAVRVARKHGLPLSVRGGGHDWAGRALRDDGLVLDLSMMRTVTVDSAQKIATVAGGAKAADVSAAASQYGLAAVTGNVGAVGMAGFLLGGGYGPLTTRFGLALDNLLGAEIVLADGQIITADAAQNSDLFWALRGGGGNFGVVTSMRIRLHSVNDVLGGIILFPLSEAQSVLHGHAKILSSAPDELSVLAGLLPAPDGDPTVFVGPIWSGEPEQGQEIMARLQRLGTAILTQIGPMSYTDLIGLYDAQVVDGRHYALQTRWLADLTPDIISALVAAGTARTSPLSFIAMHHFHGPGTQVALDATAFGLRRKHFLLEIVAAWDPTSKEDSALHRRWVSDLSSVLAPIALPGGYPNFLTSNDREQLGSAYGGNGSRLRNLKQQYDPDNVFSSTIPIPA